jgi:transposase
MNYHQNARLTVYRRVQLAKYVFEQGIALKAAAAAFNVCARTAAKWVRRYRERGRAGMRDLSSKPHRSPKQISSSLLERVLVLGRQRWNGWRIAHELKLSWATVSRVLRRAEMNRLRSLDPPPPVIRYERKHPGNLIHFDIKRLARIRKPGHRITGQLAESRGRRL